jgi:hypothetical protein
MAAGAVNAVMILDCSGLDRMKMAALLAGALSSRGKLYCLEYWLTDGPNRRTICD